MLNSTIFAVCTFTDDEAIIYDLLEVYSYLYARDKSAINLIIVAFLGPRNCCQCLQTLLTRSGDVIHPQLRPLGLGPRLDFHINVFTFIHTGCPRMNATLLILNNF